MNPARSLVERVRRSWLFDFSREFSIVVALPAEAVMDTIAAEITETGVSWQTHIDRQWGIPFYKGKVWDSGFVFSETASTFKQFPTLVVEGRLALTEQGTRIIVRSRVRQMQLAFEKVRLIILAAVPLLCILTSQWTWPTGAVAPDYSLVPYGYLAFTIGCLVCAAYLYKHKHKVFVDKVAKAEQWLRQLFADHLHTTISDAPTSAIR